MGIGICAYEGWAVLPLALVDVDAPCNFQGVSSGPVWVMGVCTNGVVCSRDSCFMENVTINGVGVCRGVGGVRLDKFANA